MPRPNLLRIDDVLLRAGRIAAFAWAMGTFVAIVLASNEEIRMASAVLGSLVAAAPPLALLVAGSKLRRREQRAWALHRLIDDHVDVAANDLLAGSDFTPATLDRAVRDLNNAGAAFLVWDRKTGRVQDGRLRTSRVTVDVCGACGAKVQIDVRLGDVTSARCPYCHDPIGAERAMEEKAALIEKLGADPAAERSRPASDSSFSVPIFVVLLFVFWPLAIGYAFLKWKAGDIRI